MDEFVHAYEMESLTLGITARKDVLDCVRRLVAQQQHAEEKEEKGEKEQDGGEEEAAKPALSLTLPGNSARCFTNRMRNIHLVALSQALAKTRAVLPPLQALELPFHHLGEEPDPIAMTKSAQAKDEDQDEDQDVAVAMDESGFQLDAAPALLRLLQTTATGISWLTHLDLRGNRLGPESCKLLCHSLAQSKTSLKCLNLNSNPLGIAGGHALANLLAEEAQSFTALQELDIGNTQLEVENIVALATALRSNRALRVLVLDNPVVRSTEEEAIQHVGKMLQVNATLQVLSLAKHALTDRGAVVLSERLLTNRGLQRLVLRANRIGATGASALAALLMKHNALQALDLSDNRIGDAGAKAMATVLRHNTRPLRVLALCSTYLTDDGLVAIAEACALPRHPDVNHLRALLLWGNDFGERSARLVYELQRHRFREYAIETDLIATLVDEHRASITASQEGHEHGHQALRVEIAQGPPLKDAIAAAFASFKR